MRPLLILLLLLVQNSFAIERRVDAERIAANRLEIREAIPLTMEHAVTRDELEWGLMQRRNLPDSYGMLFHYPAPWKISLWSFNCFIDFSVAFLDCNQVIRELRDLHSFPEKMCSLAPVRNLQDLRAISPKSQIFQFFNKRSTVAALPALYCFETNIRWFQENGVQIGDFMGWDQENGVGWIALTVDISCLSPNFYRPYVITPENPTAVSFWLAADPSPRDIAFLDGEGRVLQMGLLPGGASYPPQTRPVLASNGPVTHIVVAAAGWLASQGITVGDELQLFP